MTLCTSPLLRQPHVAINTHECTNKCQTNMYITHSGTRTHAFWGSVHAAERCQLPEIFERTEHHLSSLSSPHAPTPSFRPTGATSVYSLIQTLIAVCLLIFCLIGFFFLLHLFFPFPKLFSLHLISTCKILCNYLKSRFLRAIELRLVPGITAVMRTDNPSLKLRLKLDFLIDNIAVVAREECGHQVIDSVYMW